MGRKKTRSSKPIQQFSLHMTQVWVACNILDFTSACSRFCWFLTGLSLLQAFLLLWPYQAPFPSLITLFLLYASSFSPREPATDYGTLFESHFMWGDGFVLRSLHLPLSLLFHSSECSTQSLLSSFLPVACILAFLWLPLLLLPRVFHGCFSFVLSL